MKEVRFLELMLKAPKIMKNPLRFHNLKFNSLGDTFRIYLKPNYSVLFTRNHKLTQQILQKAQKKYHKSPLQSEKLKFYLGGGLLTSNGSYWRQQRKLIQPSFYKKKLEIVALIIRRVILDEISSIETDHAFDVYDFTTDLAFKVVAKSLFGYTSDVVTMKRMQHIIEKIQSDFMLEMRLPFLRWWREISGKRKETKRLSVELQELINKVIESRRNSNETYDDLLNILLHSTYEDGNSMTNDQLIDEILILFVAGHETTSSALTFTLALLGKHSMIQEKVLNEVNNFSDKANNLMGLFEEATFTKQCIDESMRLFPPAYFTDRMAIEDDTYGDLSIKKDQEFLISFFEIHRDPQLWEDAEEFKPERFTKDKLKNYSGIYYPFGAGSRMCVGSNFAIYEMLVTITEIIKQFEITTVNDQIDYKPLITLRPVNVILKFKSRNH